MKQGFTLLELSIVLVIIGLIIGGVTVGTDLIRAAELNTIIKEKDQYTVAVNTFKLKYNKLPGDMDNAIAYWGAAHATPATCVTTSSSTIVTCNGDGNGEIDVSTGSNEYYRFWQHLANSEILNGQFTGVQSAATGSDADSSDVGVNVPESKFSGAGWSVSGEGRAVDATMFDVSGYGNYFIFGAEVAAAPTGGKIIAPAEALNIDEKIDDGAPGTGAVIAGQWDDCTDSADATAANAIGASFALTDTAKQCALYFKDVF